MNTVAALNRAAEGILLLHVLQCGGGDDAIPDLFLHTLDQVLRFRVRDQPALGHNRNRWGNGLHIGDDMSRQNNDPLRRQAGQ
ncbi:hypothetical protein D3C81_2177930 [compost metagenome]